MATLGRLAVSLTCVPVLTSAWGHPCTLCIQCAHCKLCTFVEGALKRIDTSKLYTHFSRTSCECMHTCKLISAQEHNYLNARHNQARVVGLILHKGLQSAAVNLGYLYIELHNITEASTWIDRFRQVWTRGPEPSSVQWLPAALWLG